MNSANRIATALDFSLYTILYGDIPITQLEMTTAAEEAYQKVDLEMSQILDTAIDGGENSDLERSQEKWIDYRNAHCELVSGIKEQPHGSMSPMLYAAEAEQMTKERILQLKMHLNLPIDK